MSNQRKNQPSILGKVPPQALDLERAVLGAMMLEREKLSQAIAEVKPEHFYTDSHQLICQSIGNLFQEGKQVDMLTVTQQLRKEGNLETAGGAFYITELTEKVNSSAHIFQHAAIIKEKYLMREMIRIGSEMQSKAYDETEDVFDLMDSSQLNLINLYGGILSKKSVTIKESAMEVFQEMTDNMGKHERNELTGIPTPISKLNSFTGGWQNGDLIIIAARPAMGKTGFALACARSAAKNDDGVLFFSLEMPHTKLTYRLISQETKVCSVDEMLKGKYGQADLNAMSLKVNSLMKYKLWMDDKAAISLMELRAKANRIKAQGKLEMIVVDYLQLMSNEIKGGNREQEISTISRGLKALAKDLNIPVIALSQLSRKVEERPDRKPRLSDLRESGAIEQDADMVMFLYRPEYYEIEEMDFEDCGTISTKGLAVGIVSKNRNGTTGDFRMRFDGMHINFTDYELTSPSTTDFKWPDRNENFL